MAGKNSSENGPLSKMAVSLRHSSQELGPKKIFTLLAINFERKNFKKWLESLLIFEEMRVTAVIVVEKMDGSLFFYLSTVVLEMF